MSVKDTNTCYDGIVTTGYIYLHMEVIGSARKKDLWIDHINRDKLDNRSCNLRLVTPSQNRINSKDINNKLKTEEEKRAAKLKYRKSPDIIAAKKAYDRRRYLLKRSINE